MEKPAFIRKRLIFKYICVAVLLIAGVLCWRSGYMDAMYAHHLEAAGVSVPAEVIRIEERDDGDGGTVYDVYVQYSYEGKSYAQLDNSISGKSVRVGDVVDITIDPDNPMIIASEVTGRAETMFIYGALLLGLCCVPANLRTREGWCASFGISQETIHYDALEKAKHQFKWTGFWVAALSLGMGYVVIEISLLIVFCSILAVLGVIGACCMIPGIYAVWHRNYTVQRDRLVSKWIVTDSEDPDVHYLAYVTPKGVRYEIRTSYSNYLRASVGEEIISLFRPGKKRPYMNIHLHNKEVQ